MPRNLPWTDEEDRALRRLHSGGLPAREISERLIDAGHPPRSRNAVIGRLQRLGMSVAKKRKSPDRSRGIPSVAGSHRHCQWPEGTPGAPDFHYCGAQPEPGRPYCAEHCARAYRKRDERWDEEAA